MINIATKVMIGEPFDQSLLPTLDNSFIPKDFVGIKVRRYNLFDFNLKLGRLTVNPLKSICDYHMILASSLQIVFQG